MLGRLFGNRGWEPFEYREWTTYLVVRPLVLGLALAAGVTVGAIVGALVFGSAWPSFALTALGGVFGLALGGWYWLRRHPPM
jgi:hypothetical protein